MSVDVSWILSNGQSRVHMQYRSSSLRSNADRHRQTIDFDKAMRSGVSEGSGISRCDEKLGRGARIMTRNLKPHISTRI